MATFILTPVLVILMACGASVCAQEPDAEFRNIDRLRAALLRDYQRMSRPVKHHNTVVVVDVAFLNVMITEVDASRGSLSLTGVMWTTWTDEHLRWDQSMYGGLHEVSFTNYEVWTPDIINWSSITSEMTIKQDMDRCNVMAMSNGSVFWTPSFKSTISCDIDLNNYPADVQDCTAYFGLWVSQVNEVKLHAGLSGFKTVEFPIASHVFDVAEWKVLDHSLGDYNETELDGSVYSAVHLNLVIQRNSNMLTFLTRVPFYASAVIQIAIFLLTEVSSMERISLSIFALMLVYAESWMLNNVLLPGIPGLTVPSIIRSLELNAAEVAFNLIISQAACKFIMSCKISAVVGDRLNHIIRLIAKYQVLQFLCCTMFLANLDSNLEDKGCSTDANTLTTGVHDLVEGLEDTDADDAAIRGSFTSTPAAADRKTARTLVLLIDRCLLMQYLIFLTVFHA